MALTLRYEIVEYHLARGVRVYKARVKPIRTVKIDELVHEISQRGVTASEHDIKNCLVHAAEVIGDYLSWGYTVDSPFGIIRTTVRGKFDDWNDRFDPDRHEVDIKIVPNRRMRARVRRTVQLEKQHAEDPGPQIYNYHDASTERDNGPLTPGGLGNLYGKGLKFDANDSKQGIFFIGKDYSATRVAQGAKGSDGEIFFVVPVLPPGIYQVEVRAAPFGVLHTGELQERLVVAEPGQAEPSLPPVDPL